LRLTVVKATAVAGPVETSWTEEVVPGSPLPLGVDSRSPIVEIGWPKQSEAGPGEPTMVVVDVIPGTIIYAREEKRTMRAHVAAEKGFHHFKFLFLSLLVAVMLMDN
jgi:hypothetical protein